MQRNPAHYSFLRLLGPNLVRMGTQIFDLCDELQLARHPMHARRPAAHNHTCQPVN